MIDALTNADVFACRCIPEAGKLRIGLLCVDETFCPGEHTLYDAEEQPYRVVIPAIAEQATWGITLELMDGPV